jgi:hypothetical protein
MFVENPDHESWGCAIDMQLESIARRDNGRIPQGSNKDDLRPLSFFLRSGSVTFGFAASAPTLSWFGRTVSLPSNIGTLWYVPGKYHLLQQFSNVVVD